METRVKTSLAVVTLFIGTLTLCSCKGVEYIGSSGFPGLARLAAPQAAQPSATDIAPGVSLAPDGFDGDFGQVTSGSSTVRNLILTNTYPTQITDAVITSANQNFVLVPATLATFPSCGTLLASGQSCEIGLMFVASTLGGDSSLITASYGLNGDGQTLVTETSVYVTVVSPAILAFSVTPQPLDFGTKAAGSSTVKTLVIENIGSSRSTEMVSHALSFPFAYLGGQYPGTGGTCLDTLNAHSSCSTRIQYIPQSTSADFGIITLSYSDGSINRSSQLDLKGQGSGQLSVAINGGGHVDFGSTTVGSPLARTVVLTNSGSTDVTIISFDGLNLDFFYTGGTYPGASGTCARVLRSSDSCSISVSVNTSNAASLSTSLTSKYIDNGVVSTVVSRLTADVL
jgi:hypothetical protein